MIKPGDEPIPGYRIEQLLGRGQFGQVWRARSPGNTSLALKFLELSGTHGWKEFRAIQRVKQIRHAHLMPIVAIWLLDEQGRVISDDVIESIAASQQDSRILSPTQQTLVADPYEKTSDRPAQLVVATLLAHQSLGDRLRECEAEGRQGIPVGELLSYMAEAAKGLDYLNRSEHRIGDSVGAVQHCDVKPDNIMLTGGSVVICDFGVAQSLARARQHATATSLGGTPAYMAPECFQNKPCSCSDQYSLAVSYYELRTGRLPFEEQTYAAVYRAHQEGTLDFSACGAAEQEVLRKATATEPDNRFASCSEFVDALTQAVRPAQKPAARRDVRGAFVAMAVVGFVAAALGFFLLRGTQREPAGPMGRVSLVIEPPDARVTVDNDPLELDDAGRALVERPAGQALTVRATHPPDRLPAELRIDVVEGEQRHTLELPFSAAFFAKEADKKLAEHDMDGAVAALVKAIELDGETYARLPAPTLCLAGSEAIVRLAATPDGRAIATGSRDGVVRRWAIDGDQVVGRGEIVHRQTGEVAEVAVTDQWTASLGEDANQIVLSRTGGPTIELAVPDDAGTIQHIAVCGRGRWLVAASEVLDLFANPVRRAAALHAWDLGNERDVADSYRRVGLQENEDEPLLAGAHGGAWVVLATRAEGSFVVRRCPVDEPEETEPAHSQPGDVLAMAVSADDRWIAVGGGRVSDDEENRENRVTLIDSASGRSLTPRRSHNDSIRAIAFDPTSTYLATGDDQGDAHLWAIPDDVTTDWPANVEPVFMLPEKQAPISGVACVRAGWVACSYQGQAALWNCQSDASKRRDPKALWLSRATPPVSALLTTPNGRWLVTGHRDGTLRFWPTERLQLIERACETTGEEPRPAAETVDQVTRCDPPFRQAPRFPWENSGTLRRLPSRPSEVRAG